MKTSGQDLSEADLLRIRGIVQSLQKFKAGNPQNFEKFFCNPDLLKGLVQQSKVLLADPGRIELYADKLGKKEGFDKNQMSKSLQQYANNPDTKHPDTKNNVNQDRVFQLLQEVTKCVELAGQQTEENGNNSSSDL